MSSGERGRAKQRVPLDERKIPESRLPLPTSSLIRTSRHNRHFDKGHFKWAINTQDIEKANQKSDRRTNYDRNNQKSSPKRFSLCLSGIESSDESDQTNNPIKNPVNYQQNPVKYSVERYIDQSTLVNYHPNPIQVNKNVDSSDTVLNYSNPTNPVNRVSDPQIHYTNPVNPVGRMSYRSDRESLVNPNDCMRRSETPEKKLNPTGFRKSSLPVRVSSNSNSRHRSFEKTIFKFEEEEKEEKQTLGGVAPPSPESDLPQISVEDRYLNKRRRRKKRSDPKNVVKTNNLPTSQSSNSSMSGGSKRSSVVSDSNDSNVDTSSLGILSPTEMQSNGSLSASITSFGSMNSSFQTSWMSSVKRLVSSSATKNDIYIDDLDGDETLAEETTSSASNTLSSNPSTSSCSSLPRKSSNCNNNERKQPLKKMSIACMVPRPAIEKVARGGDSASESDYLPPKVHRFQLDTETVKEIESLDCQIYENVLTKIQDQSRPSSASTKVYDNLPPTKIPSRLPKKIIVDQTFPDMSDIFMARTEELLKSSRSKSGKKRRHTTNEEPKREFILCESSVSESCIDSSTKKINTPLPVRQNDSPPPPTDHYTGPRTFVLSEVDAGIGTSMPSSVISNNSMITSQEIGMSHYEMESSGVFSDGDPGRKSSMLSDPGRIPEIKSLEPEPPFVPTVIPEVVEETEVRTDVEEVVETNEPELMPVPEPEPAPVEVLLSAVKETSTPKLLRKERSSLTRETRPKSSLETQPKRPRSQEAKGLATKRSELLQEKPIVPNTNVGSKLKEILSRQPSQIKEGEPRKPKLPGKWDAIMNSIAEGQKKRTDVDLADRVRDVKGKVFADFKPPIIRKPRLATPDRNDSEKFSRSNSTMSTASNLQMVPSGTVSRSNSTMSSRGGANFVSRSNSHSSSDIPTNKSGKVPGSRSNSLCSTASSGKGSEVTLKDEKAKTREKSQHTFGPRTDSTGKDVSRPAQSASSAQNGKTNRKSSAPTPASRKLSINTKVVSTNAKAGPVAPNTTTSSTKPAGTVPPIPGSKNGNSSYHQPDLVKVSSPAPQHDLERENVQLRQRLGHSAKGFTAMAIALSHVSKELNALDVSKMRQEISSLRQYIHEQNNIMTQVRETYENDLKKYKNSSHAEADLELKLSDLHEQHRAFVEKLLCDHQVEIERLKESHRLDILRLGDEQDEVIRQLEARHQAQLEEADNRWRSKLSQKFECQTAELSKQETELERRDEQWAEARRILEDQIHLLKAELKAREEDIITKYKGDSLLRSTTNKLSKIQAEVDSLKAVLEMKSEELRGLRADKIRLEEKLADFDQMQAALNKATALVEDLKAQIESKNNLERKLSYENRRLYQSMEREIHEKKKLSQENEELHWKIQQSFSGSALDGAPLSTSMIDYPSSPNPMFTSLQQASLSSSYTADSGCPQSLPPFSGRAFSRVNNCHRPVSAPPGKFDFLSKSNTSTPQHHANIEPDSPRVLEVVEKTESVSWKIEYNEMEAELYASPNLKRKLSPHSPMTIRKSTRGVRPHPAGDVMSRSMIDNRGSPSPFNDLMARSCITLSRSNSSSSRKKITPPFETLSENENETKYSSSSCGKDSKPCDLRSERSTNSSNLSSISDEEDIGDISSSSEIEINEPVIDVTTPQIEAMQFLFPGGNINSKLSPETSSPDAEVTLRDELAAQSAGNVMTNSLTKKSRSRKSEGIMSKSMQTNGPSMNSVMSNSLPSYDLHRLFKGPADLLQDSGGESLMARFEEEDPLVISGMTDSTSTESDDPIGMPSHQHQLIDPPICMKRQQQQSMAESLTGVSWSEDFDQLP